MQQGSVFWGTFDFESPDFEWGPDYQRPNLPWQDLVVYEMPVRSFTADASSNIAEGSRGTFQGVTDKVIVASEQLNFVASLRALKCAAMQELKEQWQDTF